VRAPPTAGCGDLIVAVSTPPGRSRRALVRLCGAGAIAAVNARSDAGSVDVRRHIATVRLRVSLAYGESSVPALALVMPAPQTFTGEETVELLIVSAPVLLEAVIAALCDASRGAPARRAGPGEFSARAYLNGRLALDEAESIAASIAAESDLQLKAARRICGGSAARAGDEAATAVMRALALVEAGIDFTDQEDVVAITAEDLARDLARVDASLAEAVARVVPSESLRALPTVALRGAPNAGKSSLFNALLGRERSVESGIAGSTRDAIVEAISLPGGAEALLVDLPGIEDASGALEQQVQDLAHASLRDATLQLHCVPIGEECAASSDPHILLVRTKCDDGAAAPGLATSARAGIGLEALKASIAARLAESAAHGATHAGVLGERQLSALGEAREALARATALATAAIARGARGAEPVELVADELRRVLDALAVVAGRRTPDDVLAEVFARFCVGK